MVLFISDYMFSFSYYPCHVSQLHVCLYLSIIVRRARVYSTMMVIITFFRFHTICFIFYVCLAWSLFSHNKKSNSLNAECLVILLSFLNLDLYGTNLFIVPLKKEEDNAFLFLVIFWYQYMNVSRIYHKYLIVYINIWKPLYETA